MSDEDGKTRRNLMVFSSGVLAVEALEIPLDGKILGVGDLSTVDPFRAWAVAACLLVYLILRYLSSPSYTRGIGEWKTKWIEAMRRNRKKALKEAFFQADRGATRRYAMLEPAIAADKDLHSVRIDPVGDRISTGAEGEVLAILYDGSDFPLVKEGARFEYRFTPAGNRWVWWRCFRDEVWIRWPLLELVFPLPWAGAACCVVIWRLMQA